MRRTISVLALLGLSLSAFTQTKESVGKQPFYEGQKVGSIDLVANPRIDLEPYRALIVQKAGEPYSSEKVARSVKALEDTQAFSKVEPQVNPDPAGLKLTFVLGPVYYIGMVTFPGAIKRFTYTRLLQVVNLQDQSPYQSSQVQQSESALLKFFAEQAALFVLLIDHHQDRVLQRGFADGHCS